MSYIVMPSLKKTKIKGVCHHYLSESERLSNKEDSRRWWCIDPPGEGR